MDDPSEMIDLKLQITGMTCAACSARIEKVLRRVDGIETVDINLAMGSAAISIDTNKVSDNAIIQRIKQLGYGANKKITQIPIQSKEIWSMKLKFILAAIFTFPLFWSMARHYSFSSGIWVPDLFLNPWFQWTLATPVQFGIGLPFYRSAIQAIKHKTANMDLLIILSTSSSYLMGHYLTFHTPLAPMHAFVYFETSTMIFTVILLGKLLEALTKERTFNALQKLHQLQAKTANVIRHHLEYSVSIESIQLDEVVIVRPGEQIPVDGIIVEGRSSVDESLITGESIPVDKQVRDKVISGAINRNGVLKVKVSHIGTDTALAKIIHMIEEAQASKMPIQRITDGIAQVFVPIVIGLACITFIAWDFWLMPGDGGGALQKAMAILVIACPCALGLATPTSILVGSGRAAEAGILFKEGKYMEGLQQINVILLDKTGTITLGIPSVQSVLTSSGNESALLRLSAAVEQNSEHPLARAVVKEARLRGIAIPVANYFTAVTGYGVVATVDDLEIRIGSRKYMEQQGVILGEEYIHMIEQERKGNTLLFVAAAGRLAGIIAVADPIKASSATAIARLKRLKIKVMMVTGDYGRTASAIAKEAGIYRVYAEMLPEEKVGLIKRLQNQGKKVAMVGDGMNDAPALAAADLGIAMGTGADVSKEAADINLLQSDLNGIADAFWISKKTMRNIRQNLGFAFVYNLIAIPFAFMGWLEPWIAGAAMAFSSITVVGNALRLNRAITHK
ncbi:MAG: heavy metal translocating P-type ATPase [Paenibacillaceae bacterium]